MKISRRNKRIKKEDLEEETAWRNESDSYDGEQGEMKRLTVKLLQR
jgi:hypothetical protein